MDHDSYCILLALAAEGGGFDRTSQTPSLRACDQDKFPWFFTFDFLLFSDHLPMFHRSVVVILFTEKFIWQFCICMTSKSACPEAPSAHPVLIIRYKQEVPTHSRWKWAVVQNVNSVQVLQMCAAKPVLCCYNVVFVKLVATRRFIHLSNRWLLL